MPWRPGESGNPLGPYNARQAAIKRRLEGLTLKAVDVLAETMATGDPHLRLAAAKEVLDRSLGRPRQQATLEVTHSATPHLAALVGLAAGAIGGAPQRPVIDLGAADVLELAPHLPDDAHSRVGSEGPAGPGAVADTAVGGARA